MSRLVESRGSIDRSSIAEVKFWRSSSRLDCVFLVVSNLESPFVSIDCDILESCFETRRLCLKKKWSGLAEAVCSSFSASIGLGWFASWHTFPVSLVFWVMRNPFLLVIGGYDLAKMPEIAYGHQRGGPKKWISRATMHLATRLITNSNFSRFEAGMNAGLDPRRVAVVYHGVRDLFGAMPEKPDEALAITVGNVDRANLLRKGHEPFVRAAASLPDVEFWLIGAWKDDAIDFLKSIATPNVRFLGRVSDDVLRESFTRASVYVQASAHEGFGMSLAEAMLGGCVPVVSHRGSIPEVVGDSGIVLGDLSPESIGEGILRGLEQFRTLGPKARDRVLVHFPLEVRKSGLLQEVGFLQERSGVVL